MKMSLRALAIALGFGFLVVAALPQATAQSAKKKEFAATGTGSIKGKVTLDGDAPAPSKLKIDPNNKDAGHCGKGDTEDLTWVVDKDKGLANVVVFLKPPSGQFFKVDLGNKTWEDHVTIDQPFCRFNPHVSALFADYEDKPVQKLVVKNSAPVAHNSRVTGGMRNPAKGGILAPGKQEEYVLKSDAQKIVVSCDVHKWMEAYIWAFDHPYFAITGADGSFEIKNAPYGADVWIWHDSLPPNGKEFKKGVAGENLDIKVKYKK